MSLGRGKKLLQAFHVSGVSLPCLGKPLLKTSPFTIFLPTMFGFIGAVAY